MNKKVVVFVFARNSKKKSNVYKICVIDDNYQPQAEDIVKCDGNNFTLNPNVALFIAHSEAKKINSNTFTMYYLNEVANFEGLKNQEKK